MHLRVLFVVVILFSASCQSDVIPCPDTKVQKLRETRINNARSKRMYSTHSSSASERIHQQRQIDVRRDALVDKKPESAEDWECPQPGTRKHDKLLKENRKKREKLMREASKKRKDIDPMSTVLPYSASE